MSGTTSGTCVDWVHFDTPQDIFNQAGVVVIGKPLSQDGQTSIYGYTAQTHLVKIEKVLKGDTGANTMQISAMPETCTGGVSYPDGDPLETSRRLIIFLTKDDGKWFTFTPAQGVLSFDNGTALPFHQ
ncbi:hypothetical protein [Arthrobacter sp. H14-L1]|uniref:hypothetical protein n=1 Tax=Arthrobacter sp. H14-L1 TaxID=2996697 RepID=UPI00226DA3F9|nr:hypothetical protein [Arthrobacter sp. H14-L1]MCY0905372.1 hypothetical protein [Arthrobacter sp. H14-L1]